MNTVKILVHKELATTFNSWSIYIGYTLFFCVCGFFSWLSSNNLLYIGQEIGRASCRERVSIAV